MCSLDAMAEACAIAHAADDEATAQRPSKCNQCTTENTCQHETSFNSKLLDEGEPAHPPSTPPITAMDTSEALGNPSSSAKSMVFGLSKPSRHNKSFEKCGDSLCCKRHERIGFGPFIARPESSQGPPSPEKSFMLPFRPKFEAEVNSRSSLECTNGVALSTPSFCSDEMSR